MRANGSLGSGTESHRTLPWEVDGQYPGGKGSWGQQDQSQPWTLGTSLGMDRGEAGTQACG